MSSVGPYSHTDSLMINSAYYAYSYGLSNDTLVDGGLATNVPANDTRHRLFIQTNNDLIVPVPRSTVYSEMVQKFLLRF